MRTKKIQLFDIQKKYKAGGYVLLSEKEDKVLVFGKSVKKLYDLARKKGLDKGDTTTMYVPPKNKICVFTVFRIDSV